jgi:uncharacterized membrane protein
MSEQLEERLDRLERTLWTLQDELTEIRRLTARAPLPAPVPQPPVSTPRWQPPEPAPVKRAAAPAGPSLSARIAEELGARALALTGGAVTLLGVVLLFALAVNRGWIGPWERCGIGFAASGTVFVGGLWLRRRYGTMYSALAAVGAGIGGAYASLLAAAALYELLPAWAALVVAGAIASAGVVTSIAWSAEIVAGLGLVGAILVPIAVVFDGGLTVLGTSFVAVVLAAAGVVALWRRWRGVLAAAVAASLPQAAVLVAMSDPGSARVAVLAGVFGLLYLALAIAEQLRGPAGLQPMPASLALLAAVLAGGSAIHLFDATGEGLALLAVGGVYGAAASAFLVRRSQRDLSSLLWAVGLAAVAVGLADLASGDALAIAWAAEAAVLAWLAVRTREPRFQLGAIAYLALATGHAFAFDAPFTHVFAERAHPAEGAVSVVAAALAAAIVAFYARSRPWLREAFLWLAALLTTYAASLGILEPAELAGGFDWGHVPVSALWALLAAALLVLGARRRAGHLVSGGAVWLGVTLAKSFGFDLLFLSEPAALYAAYAVGAIVLFAGYLYGREGEEPGVTAIPVECVLASAALLVIAVTGLVDGHLMGIDLLGAALLGIGACYGLLAATVLRSRRDLSTLLWATGLAIVLGAWPELVGATPLVVAWAATGAALSWLGRFSGEDRLQVGAAASILLALVWAVVDEAPPSDLFVAGWNPGHGVVALVAVALATGVLARHTRRLAWLAGALAVEAVSLAILQLFQWSGTGSVHLEFQRGHTAVSAFWGVLGLTALYLGLARRSRGLRLAGFAIFGVSLAKIFLYDLSALSSITRALSFLAVGAVLLLGGFFYQRLSSQVEERPAPG